MDFILKEYDRSFLNKPEQHTALLMMLQINPNAGSCFHCHSMTWDAPSDFAHDTAVTFREINLTSVYPKL
jgi:hypothetical protein